MALSITSNYAGKESTGYISQAIFGCETLAGNYLTIYPNVKHKLNIKRADFGDLLQSYACDFSSSGTLTLDENILDPTRLSAMYEMCITGFEATWDSERMLAGANNSAPSPDLASHIVSRMAAHVNSELEKEIWRGNFTGNTAETSGYTKFTGLLRTFDTATGTVKVAGTTLSQANIINEIQRVYNSIPEVILDAADMRIYVSKTAAKYYKQALASANTLANYVVGDRPLDFMGMQIVALPGLPTNVMAAFRTSNVVFGTDLTADFNEVKLVDMRETLASDNFRYRMNFSAGVQIGYGAEIVLYK